MGFIAIADYGAGNLMSVTNALRFLGAESRITDDTALLEKADKIILPGVGAFPPAMEDLRRTGFAEEILIQAKKKPLLGICLGMQMLLDIGYETVPCEGLGLIPGEVQRIETSLKLPHIGWNSLHMKNPCPLLKDVPEGSYVYFVHSFCAVPKDGGDLMATTDYGTEVAAVIARGNIFGTQFHPEKSGDVGLQILRNFCSLS